MYRSHIWLKLATVIYCHIQMAYKIKIECTNFKDLTFNNRPIDSRNYYAMLYELAPEEDDRIEYIHILNRTSYRNKSNMLVKFYLKRLEIFFNTLLTRNQFKDYIKKMINLSFYSINGICIDFVDINENCIIYRYKFMTITPVDIPKMKCRLNKYSYKIDNIYHK